MAPDARRFGLPGMSVAFVPDWMRGKAEVNQETIQRVRCVLARAEGPLQSKCLRIEGKGLRDAELRSGVFEVEAGLALQGDDHEVPLWAAGCVTVLPAT